jgi:predicted ATP-grasp superfamily ATP-dependent carboligase
VNLFVYEYFSARNSTAALRQEGWAMLQAVAEDLARIPDTSVRTLLAAGMIAPPNCTAESPQPDEETAFRRLASWADYSLIIAPEWDDLLEIRCRWVEEERGKLLGPTPAAVALTADKLVLAEFLQARGVATPATYSVSNFPDSLTCPVVCKPRHGAGSQASFFLHQPSALPSCLEIAWSEGITDEMILQPFVPGQPASVAFLVGPRQWTPLAPASQEFSEDGRFHYRGGVIPLPVDLAKRAIHLARAAVTAVPGLKGYVGVDVVLGPEDYVIEINPRLTTSYIGLRALADANPAELMLRVATGETIFHPRWQKEPIRFRADGTLERLER